MEEPGSIRRLDLYFHKDFDGVISALAYKEMVQVPGLTVVPKEAQYGEILSQEVPAGDINALVDFAEGFDGLQHHIDHHSGSYQANASCITEFYPGAKSNAGVLITELLKRGGQSILLLSLMAEAADCIDSAGHHELGFSHNEQRRYIIDEEVESCCDMQLKMQHYFALNKTLMALKNKHVGSKRYLERFVQDCETWHPVEMLHLAYELALQVKVKGKPLFEGSPREFFEMLQKNGDDYRHRFGQSGKPVFDDGILVLNQPITSMFALGSYDRYVPFEAYPDTRFLINNWPGMGLLQVSCNPARQSDADLISVVEEGIGLVLPDAETDMRFFKRMIKSKAVGELIPPRADLLEILLGDRAEDIAGRQLRDAEDEELEQYRFNVLDLISNTYGGHRAIANIPHLGAYGEQRKEMTDRLIEFVVGRLG
ncbi:hypothetical protein JW968_05855 [Candidatus Woesearchaeota archaeon]|nr:hypothetical protein [Candidatus Woesearchaeota archaeon]